MNQPIVKNAADEKQLEEADKKVKVGKEAQKAALKEAMEIPAFRRWAIKFVNLCDRISVDPSGSMTYFKEGERNQALIFKADLIEADPNAYLLMMKEK